MEEVAVGWRLMVWRVMRKLTLGLILGSLACGGSQAVSFSGHWREQLTQRGSGYEMMLTGSGTTIAGDGIRHREAGTDTPFTVSGSSSNLVPGHGVTFDYGNGVTEGFSFNQPDAAHLDLTDSQNVTHVFLRLNP